MLGLFHGIRNSSVFKGALMKFLNFHLPPSDEIRKEAEDDSQGFHLQEHRSFYHVMDPEAAIQPKISSRN